MRNPISSPPSKTAPKHSKTTPCCAKVEVKRGPWTPEEDEILSAYINKEGEGRWRTLPKRAGLSRCGKSCRLRWMNYLRPSVKRGHIGPDEEDIILRLHRLLGNRWSLIAGRISGRTDNEIKNYWNTHLSKKLISQGIDPRTHKPLNPNDLQSSQIPSSSNPDQSKNAEPIFPITPFSHDPVVSTHFNEDFVGYYHDGENINHCKGLNLQNSNGIRNDDDDDINYCTDDVFSSFLNSLVNEDLFNNNHNQVQQEQIINGSNVVPPSDGLISLPYTGCAFGAGWDAPIMSDSNQNNEPKRFINDQVEKH